MHEPSDYQYKRWTVICLSYIDRKGNKYYKCQCSCGTIKNVRYSTLRNGESKSCGCLASQLSIKRNKTHGLSYTKVYNTWARMLQRCEGKRDSDKRNYSDRGIRVCKKWHKFENFLADMGLPKPKETLDRINNDKGYYPKNCRWASWKIQVRNTRRNRYITWKGKTLCICEWAETLKINQNTLQSRISKGWPIARAFTEPVHREKQRYARK